MHRSKQKRYIVCVGYPNAGKTSSFNFLTHSHFKVVNYPGSTVVYNVASFRDAPITLVDTPGVVTFSPHSDDEKVTFTALTQLDALVPGASTYPDLILYVADALQLERHLMGFRLLQQQGYPLVLLVTRSDWIKKYKGSLDREALEKQVNCPVFYGNARSGDGLPTSDDLMAILDGGRAYVPERLESMGSWRAAAIWAKECVGASLVQPVYRNSIDRWILHPVYGAGLFFGVMIAFFFLIFFGATPAVGLIEWAWALMGDGLHHYLPAFLGSQFLIDGVFTNMGAVLVFVPQIFLLFLAMEFLDGSGYLARAAVIIDRPLSKLGLTGKSFVPILSGAACAIPAMLATRGLTHKSQRLITLWMIPLMPCSARLPVYGLLLAILFHGRPFYSALGMVMIYGASIFVAMVVGKLVSLWLKPPQQGFYMELPHWQWPQWQVMIRNSFRSMIQFVKRAGPVIMILSVLIWAFSSYPTPEHSVLITFGHWISPIFSPMGWDWRIGVAVLASFAAREVFVSVLASLLVLGPDQLATQLVGGKTALMSTPSIIALIVFFMISLQCGTTIVVMKKELGSWKMPLLMTASYIALAYILAVLIYQVGILF